MKKVEEHYVIEIMEEDILPTEVRVELLTELDVFSLTFEQRYRDKAETILFLKNLIKEIKNGPF